MVGCGFAEEKNCGFDEIDITIRHEKGKSCLGVGDKCVMDETFVQAFDTTRRKLKFYSLYVRDHHIKVHRSWTPPMPYHCHVLPNPSPNGRPHRSHMQSNQSSHITLPRSLEEEPYDKNLQASHTHHHQTLNNTEVKDPPLRTPDRTKIAILSRAEIFLIPCNGRKLA